MTPNSYYEYGLKLFCKGTGVTPTLYIGPRPREGGWQKALAECKVAVNIDLDRDTGELLGIDPGRWEIMEAWLGKWLPKNQDE